MRLKQFENEIVSEISMVELAKAILERRGEVMDFNDIIAEVADFIDIDQDEMNKRMPQFYTDLNVDGEFISLGENTWGLRSWFPIDSINEVLTHENDEEDMIPHISDDGFDDYEKAALEKELKDAAEAEEIEDEDFDDEDDDDADELSEYQEDIETVESDDEEDVELEDIDVLDENELLIDDDDEDDL